MRVAVLGATGFTGEKLVEILLSHPKVELVYLASRTLKPVAYSKLFPHFSKKTNLKCQPLNIEKAAVSGDFFFLSLPHTLSMEFVPYLLKKKKKVIDLSADYRLKNATIFRKYYKKTHKDKVNLKKAVYGLAEVNKASIKKAKLVANPGCYPTSIILALFPLVKDSIIKGKIVVDSKSSITGAGRKAARQQKEQISNNLWAYKPFIHQHSPEIVSILKEKTSKKIDLCFQPHVIDVDSGIYSTIYLNLNKKVTAKKIKSIYKKYYQGFPFIKIKDSFPKLKDVAGTNFCHIGFSSSADQKQLIVVCAIDNLIKGAAGSAVQNMNIMSGFKESLGLL